MENFKDLHETTGEALPVSQESPVVTSPGGQNMTKHALPIQPVHRTAAKRFKAAVRGTAGTWRQQSRLAEFTQQQHAL